MKKPPNAAPRLLAALIVFVLGATIAGCDDGSIVPTGTFARVSSPTGTVLGLVTDTNGAPLADVQVSLAGKTVTTDAQGQYRFDRVKVVQAAGADADTGNALTLVITPPAGYLSAVVTVRPEAQLDGTATSENLVTVFIDGFNVSAGTAVLPATTASLRGVLRDGVSGRALAGTRLALDLVSVQGAQQAEQQNGVSSTYRAVPMIATSGSAGEFTMSNLPADARLRYAVEGFVVVTGSAFNGDGTVSTTDEDLVVNEGDLMAVEITSNDTIFPSVARVVGIGESTAAVGRLARNVDGTGAGLIVEFSEPVVAALGGATVLLWNETAGDYVAGTASLSADGRSLAFVAGAPVAAGSDLHLNLLRADLHDAAGNPLVTGNAIGYDSQVGNTDYLRLSLRTFADPRITGTLALAQEAGAANAEVAPVGVGNDVNADVADVQQLNSAADDNNNGVLDDVERTNDLLARLGLGTALDVASQAVVSFAQTTASGYRVVIRDESGDNVTGLVARGASDNVTLAYDSVKNWLTLTPVDDGDVRLLLADAPGPFLVPAYRIAPGFTVEVTSLDGLGYPSQLATLVLADEVAPYPVTQSAFGLFQVAASPFVVLGNGAEIVTGAGEGLLGPVLAVGPGLLADPGLMAANGSTNAAAPANFGLPVPATATGFDATQFAAAYDPLAMSTWLNARSARIGVAFSEDVALTSALPAYDGAAPLSAWAVSNDVVQSIEGDVVNVDLAVFSANPLLLAADDGSVLDFGGAVRDDAGNVAPSTPVYLRDRLPPMLTRAEYRGSSLFLEFNEAIDPAAVDGTRSVRVYGDAGAGLTSYNILVRGGSYVAGNVLVVDLRSPVFVSFPSGFFSLGDNNNDTVPDMGAIGTDAIADIHGNRWSNFGSGPVAALIDTIGQSQFVITVASASGNIAGSTQMTVSFAFNHPVVEAMLDTDTAAFPVGAMRSLQTDLNFDPANSTALWLRNSGIDGIANTADDEIRGWAVNLQLTVPAASGNAVCVYNMLGGNIISALSGDLSLQQPCIFVP